MTSPASFIWIEVPPENSVPSVSGGSRENRAHDSQADEEQGGDENAGEPEAVLPEPDGKSIFVCGLNEYIYTASFTMYSPSLTSSTIPRNAGWRSMTRRPRMRMMGPLNRAITTGRK